MLKGETINGYKILKDGVMNGMCSWTFALKGDKEFFIKEFLHPTFPTPDAPGSSKTKEKKKADCDVFEKHQKQIVNTVRSKCSVGGNLIFAIDFFRNGTKYYKVTEKIDVASIPLSEISTLDMKKKVLIMTTVSFSLTILHDVDIVHGDLKPDNILIKKIDSGLKKVDGGYTTKLIDFDSSFFNKQPPEISEEVVGDIAYYSPELLRYIKNDETTKREHLTTKSDIFALGLIFSKYLTNNFPTFDREKYKFISVAANNGTKIMLASDVCPKELEQLINSMLALNPVERPEIKEVHRKLRSLLISKELLEWKPLKETEAEKIEIKGKLKISMGSKKETVIIETALTSSPSGSRVKFGKGLKK